MEDSHFKILATEVKAGLELLSVKMDDIKEKQEEVAAVVNRVEKSLYEPDKDDENHWHSNTQHVDLFCKNIC